MFAGSHTLRAHVFTRLVCSRADVLVCFTFLLVYLLARLACSCVYVLTWLRFYLTILFAFSYNRDQSFAIKK